MRPAVADKADDGARRAPRRMIRNATLDYARPVAAIGIIVFHTGGIGAEIGYAGLPFFLILLVFLAFPVAATQPFPIYAKGRIARLMRPWAVWSGIYGALKLADVWLADAPFAAEFAPWMLLAGPAIHLWFLPFACVACLMLWPLARRVVALPAAGRVMLAAGCGGLAVLLVAVQKDVILPLPFAQWAFAAPAVALGVAFAVPGDRAEWQSPGAAAITAGTAIALWQAGWPPGSGQLVLAASVMVACLAWRLPDTRLARTMADTALTLYLAPPLVASVLKRTTLLPDQGPALALTTVCVTILVALILRRERPAGAAV